MSAKVVVSEQQVVAAEQRSLRAYMYAMLGFAVIGFVVYAVSGVAATQLDGVISLINAASAFIAARLAFSSIQPPTPEAPYGRLALENLYVLFRSLMIFGVIVVGLVTNGTRIVEYVVTRTGSEPDFGIAAVYTAVVSAACFGLMWNHIRNNRSVGGASALLRVEKHAARMEATISAGISTSLLLVTLMPEGTFLTSASFNIKYIADSVIVVVLCLLLVRDPVNQVRSEFNRLSGKRMDADLDDAVRRAINDVNAEHGSQAGHDFELIDVMAIRRGKITEVDLRVSYAGAMTVAEQDDIRERTHAELIDRVGQVRLYLFFTQHEIHHVPDADPAPL